jgi:hypothetical protein
MSEIPPIIGVTSAEDDAQRKLAADYRNTIVEIQSKLFDKSSAYANLIMVGGYAGAFAIWSYTKTSLTQRGNVATALLLGFSLSVFIFFEIYKMGKSILHYNQIRSLLNENLPIPEFFVRFNRMQAVDAKQLLQTGTLSAAICLFVCATSAMAAMIILFYNFLAVLLGWRLWP